MYSIFSFLICGWQVKSREAFHLWPKNGISDTSFTSFLRWFVVDRPRPSSFFIYKSKMAVVILDLHIFFVTLWLPGVPPAVGYGARVELCRRGLLRGQQVGLRHGTSLFCVNQSCGFRSLDLCISIGSTEGQIKIFFCPEKEFRDILSYRYFFLGEIQIRQIRKKCMINEIDDNIIFAWEIIFGKLSHNRTLHPA